MIFIHPFVWIGWTEISGSGTKCHWSAGTLEFRLLVWFGQALLWTLWLFTWSLSNLSIFFGCGKLSWKCDQLPFFFFLVMFNYLNSQQKLETKPARFSWRLVLDSKKAKRCRCEHAWMVMSVSFLLLSYTQSVSSVKCSRKIISEGAMLRQHILIGAVPTDPQETDFPSPSFAHWTRKLDETYETESCFC